MSGRQKNKDIIICDLNFSMFPMRSNSWLWIALNVNQQYNVELPKIISGPQIHTLGPDPFGGHSFCHNWL